MPLEQVVGGCVAEVDAYDDEAGGESVFATRAEVGLDADCSIGIA